MKAKIETKLLTKVYNTTDATIHALHEVDFKLANGEFVAIMGPSGCGKSTLLHLLGGLDTPTSGEIYLNGIRIDNQNESQLAIIRRRSVGFVFQFFNLIGNLSVSDNIELPGLLIGCSRHELKRRRDELLSQLGLTNKANAAPMSLSGGEQQRVALARALINDPDVLLADEPTGNLDSKNGKDVVNLICDFHARGQTIVLVTHDPKVASVAERIVFLRDGVVVTEITTGSERGRPDFVFQKIIDLGD